MEDDEDVEEVGERLAGGAAAFSGDLMTEPLSLLVTRSEPVSCCCILPGRKKRKKLTIDLL